MFLSALNVEPDELHVLHIGCSQYLLGSVLWALVYGGVLTGSLRDNMARVWEEILVEYAEQNIEEQFSSITLNTFIDPEHPRSTYPKLKGRGGEIKSLVPAMATVWGRLKRDGNEHDDRMMDLLSSAVTIQELISDHKYDLFMLPEASRQLRNAIDVYLHMWTVVGQMSDAMADMEVNAVPKLHWLYHLGIRSMYLSPRRGACFIDEDFVKCMKQICQKCVAGQRLHRVPHLLFEKYAWSELFEMLSMA